MDPLLSLCNLYAEGPRTVGLLARRGVRTLPAVLALPSERLAELLGGSPAVARRFQREAALASACARARDPEESARSEPNGTHLDRAAPFRGAPERALDVDVTARVRGSVVRSRPHTLARRAELESPGTLATRRAPEPVHTPSASDLLRPALLAGLDVRTCECLVAEGVRTVGQLASAPPARLATLAGLPLALVTGLCADAAACTGLPPRTADAASDTEPRATERSVPRASNPEHDAERIVEWTPPPPRRSLNARPDEPALVDVAGPFAGEVEVLAAKAWLSARES